MSIYLEFYQLPISPQQIIPKLDDLKQHTFISSPEMQVRNPGAVYICPLAQGPPGCNQGAGQGCDLMCKLYWGRAYFQAYLHLYGCNQDAVPGGLLAKGLQFLPGCWSETTLSSLPHNPLQMASYFIRSSKRECQNERERVTKREVTVLHSISRK